MNCPCKNLENGDIIILDKNGRCEKCGRDYNQGMKIPMNLETIEKTLAQGQVPPPTLAEMRDWLAVLSSSQMDKQDELIDLYADWFHANRKNYGSDKAADNAWNQTELGKEKRRLETLQKRIKLLISSIASHLRVASDQARNLY